LRELVEKLIEKNFNGRKIDLVKVTAGDSTIAIMYNMIENHVVHFYLQGVNYENN